MRIPVPGAVEQALDTALDRALSVQRSAIDAYVERIRRKDPFAPPAEVLATLERRYLQASTAMGGAAGAAAAVPGIGTGASLAAGAAEIAAFVEMTALYALAVARVHGLDVEDPERRRALVMAVLLGESGLAVLESVGGREARWAEVIARRGSRDGIGSINRRLASVFVKRFGTRQGALLVGRALPFGVGAGIGAVGNRALARAAITSARRAFGPPPPQFGPSLVKQPAN